MELAFSVASEPTAGLWIETCGLGGGRGRGRQIQKEILRTPDLFRAFESQCFVRDNVFMNAD
jgi:hypothetical protein